ncbi:DUF6559 family protein [Thalassotalea euphylliae]|uniref:DUF6559 family protein n=1 Tax=Thalassotalea euphylliae TaxID=1655234 RepID=UPI00363CD4EC
MLDTFQNKASIKNIARTIPRQLIKHASKKTHYTAKEVEFVFLKQFESATNIHYAYAMFCAAGIYTEVANKNNFQATYKELRSEVSDACFEGWPHFNFDSFLSDLDDTSLPETIADVVEIGADFLKGL